MDENFLLNTPLSQYLFHECAKELPIIDYHNHLDRKELQGEMNYENITKLWITRDAYKHRAMRICGVEEKRITGSADDFDKFRAWMDTLPKLIGNPLYDWSILEMKRIFDMDVNPEAMDIEFLWKEWNQKLSTQEYSAKKILARFHVEYAAPCEAATENIDEYLNCEGIVPSMRGDSLVNVSKEEIEALEESTQRSIDSLEDYLKAISLRFDAFEMAGCKFSDHALDHGFRYVQDDGENEERFLQVRNGKTLENDEKEHLASAILRYVASCYAQKEWTMQLHIGAQRNTSTRLRTLAGPAGGYAGISDGCDISSLVQMLDDFEKASNGLPRIVLFTLNPSEHALMAVLSGSYSEDGVVGKVGLGPAWWWCDHIKGMKDVLENIASFSVLSTFIGMTTDSRSILSFSRHEYFRRVLCQWIGEKVEAGEIISSTEQLKKLVKDVCYQNAKRLILKGKVEINEF